MYIGHHPRFRGQDLTAYRCRFTLFHENYIIYVMFSQCFFMEFLFYKTQNLTKQDCLVRFFIIHYSLKAVAGASRTPVPTVVSKILIVGKIRFGLSQSVFSTWMQRYRCLFIFEENHCTAVWWNCESAVVNLCAEKCFAFFKSRWYVNNVVVVTCVERTVECVFAVKTEI